MSLPLLHAGRTNPGLSAALDLRFALDKSLTAYRGPTPSFSRASTGSYFDGSGVLRYATVNILTYSENFSDASWLKNSTTISSDSVIAPDGKTTADTLTSTSSTAIHYLEKTGYTVSTVQYTISIFAKYGTHRYLQISANNESSGVYANFDLFSGVVGSVGASATSQITNVGGGWYRCSMTYTATSTASRPLLVMVSSSTAPRVESITLTSGDYFYIWGCQQEASSTVGTYCPTTSSANSAPRFNHTFNGTSWVSRGLLVEEQRTNICLNSQDFVAATWAKGSNVSVTGNTDIAPDGSTTADTITATTSNEVTQTFTTISGQTYTYSCFFKKTSGATKFPLIYAVGSGLFVGVFLDTNTGATGNYATSPSSVTVQDCGSYWRLSFPFTTNTTSSQIKIYPAATTDLVNFNTSNNSVVVWQFQVELGAFATSAIPTTSGSVTRSADVCQITGADFSGFWNGTEGSVACEFDRIGNKSAADQETFNFSNAGGTEQIYHDAYGGSDYVLYYAGNATQANLSAGSTSSVGTITKIATAYKVNDFALSTNGGAAVTDTSGTVPAPDRLWVGSGISNLWLNGHIARLRYFNKRLPNATLQQLSNPDPTLNLQFALNKSLTPVAGPAPSFSRASTGTYFNASGVLTSASINTPRFDHVYSGGQWVSRGLLVEEQRTNYCLQSAFQSGWQVNLTALTANQDVSPDGTTTAAKLVPSSTGTYRSVYQSITNSNCLSVYAKASGTNWISFINTAGNAAIAWFNISSGTVGTVSSGYTGTIQNVGNGWYRCTVTNASNFSFIQINLADADNTATATLSGTNGVLLWGAQAESGAFPTSYIGTTTSSVTRSADVCQITGTSFNWMWNQGEGSVAVEFDQLADASKMTNESYIYGFQNATDFEQFILRGQSSGIYYWRSVNNGNVEASAQISSLGTATVKHAACYKLNDFASTFNGAAVVSDTSGATPAPTLIGIGFNSISGSNRLNGHIAKLVYYPARLTNTKLQQLST